MFLFTVGSRVWFNHQAWVCTLDLHSHVILLDCISLQTQGHQYHIHVGRIGILRDPRNPSGHCANAFAGPHYNPFNTSIDPTYAKQCSPQNPYRCELGDTSKKTSYLAVRGMPQYHVDADMPLTGRFTGKFSLTRKSFL